jgi:hypothetical protein
MENIPPPPKKGGGVKKYLDMFANSLTLTNEFKLLLFSIYTK